MTVVKTSVQRLTCYSLPACHSFLSKNCNFMYTRVWIRSLWNLLANLYQTC